MNKHKNALFQLNDTVKHNWRNNTYFHIPSQAINTVKQSSSHTSTSPYDVYAQQFLDDAESEIKDDYKSRRETRIELLRGLTIYFIFLGIIIIYALMCKNNIILKIILASGLFSSIIGLLIIVFKYAFTTSDKYYQFVENIMKWAYEKHKYDR